MDDSKPIGAGLAFGLITLGVMIDFIQMLLAILVIGILLAPVLNFVAMIGMAIMLHHHGGGILKRRAPSYTFGAVIEFMPILDVLPAWTFFAVYTVVMDKWNHRSKAAAAKTPRKVGGSWRL